MKPVPAELRDTIAADYERLCKQLGLKTVPLDIYITELDSDEKTDFGFPVKYPYAGYDQAVIHLPLDEVAIQDAGHALELFPFIPKRWDMRSPEWPAWRINLWHETVHQYEHKVLDTWKAGVELGPSWHKAVEGIASRLGVSGKEISSVIEGVIVPLVKAP